MAALRSKVDTKLAITEEDTEEDEDEAPDENQDELEDMNKAAMVIQQSFRARLLSKQLSVISEQGGGGKHTAFDWHHLWPSLANRL